MPRAIQNYGGFAADADGERCLLECLGSASRGDDDRIADKFRWLAGHIMDESRTVQLLEMLWQFDDVPDLREFTRVLA